MTEVQWLHTFGHVRMGVFRHGGVDRTIRLLDIETGKQLDLQGCQRQRLLTAFDNCLEIDIDNFFGLGEKLRDEGCSCNNLQCCARTELHSSIKN